MKRKENWRNDISSFRLRKFEEVTPFLPPNVADVDVNTKIVKVISDPMRSRETMQYALAPKLFSKRKIS